MKQPRLSMYTVNIKYIRNLHNRVDDHVFSVSPQTGKSSRLFLGIVLVCDGKPFCIPLSSPKEKHKSMKNGVDFHKILDAKGKLIGVLNFNNMIPVRGDVIQKFDVAVHTSDAPAMKRYKNLVIDQLTFCRKNQEALVAKATKLYRMIANSHGSTPLKRRCLPFQAMEKELERFTIRQQS